MNIFNCLIVDDEPIARDIIRNYCGHLPYLNIVAASGNALEAKTILHQQKIDILFLDINMPIMDGISFLKTLKNPPQVIFTTAYKEYALDAFDLSACDYLLKPFSLERFMIAVDKATERSQNQVSPVAENSDVNAENFVFIKADGKIFKILFSNLLYAEAYGNYTKIVTANQTLLPAQSFTTTDELLPKSIFIRIHRSFLVNKSKIDHIEGNRIFINNNEIPVGRNYKDSFLKELGFHS